jgi:hypothetical protein
MDNGVALFLGTESIRVTEKEADILLDQKLVVEFGEFGTYELLVAYGHNDAEVRTALAALRNK